MMPSTAAAVRCEPRLPCPALALSLRSRRLRLTCASRQPAWLAGSSRRSLLQPVLRRITWASASGDPQGPGHRAPQPQEVVSAAGMGMAATGGPPLSVAAARRQRACSLRLRKLFESWQCSLECLFTLHAPLPPCRPAATLLPCSAVGAGAAGGPAAAPGARRRQGGGRGGGTRPGRPAVGAAACRQARLRPHLLRRRAATGGLLPNLLLQVRQWGRQPWSRQLSACTRPDPAPSCASRRRIPRTCALLPC